jgi:hypothetical protein
VKFLQAILEAFVEGFMPIVFVGVICCIGWVAANVAQGVRKTDR